MPDPGIASPACSDTAVPEPATLRCTGTSVDRIILLHGRLCRGERVTAESLAGDLEVSSRTIRRDVERLRDRFGAPVEWDFATRTFYYTRECPVLPLLRIDADEALALAVAGRVLAARPDSVLGRLLMTVLAKMAPLLGGSESLPLAAVNEALSVPADIVAVQDRHLLPLIGACYHRRELRLAYRQPGARSSEHRVVHPQQVTWLDRGWVLIARDAQRGTSGHFLLGRIADVEPTGRLFEPQSRPVAEE